MNEAHPEPADIAALDEDLLPPDDAARLRDHLDRCATCADVHADLAALRQALGDLPDPGPIPEDIADRIDTALAAERTAASAASVSRETTPRPVSAAERRARRARLALAAAGAVVFLGVGGTLLPALSGSGGGNEGDSGSEAAMEGGEVPEAADGEPLEDQVQALLATTETNSPMMAEEGMGAEGPPDRPSPETQSATAIPACVVAAIGRTEAPLAVEEERYDGVNAYLVVLPHAADPEQVDAYVVAATCEATASPASGEILVRESYPRE
ncbi:anti-sigma factor family protein [Streptomyces marincola]|uniref:anti-sigma factor family protein n=1 Tax=Streptomyces marincola TaxID=2878388 RepID=UPI001CF1FEA6|nr:hypothetical protein [Streptomyces marincola]UCM89100.1 hypothetical protein LC193_14695 [Streptomyces marincola]